MSTTSQVLIHQQQIGAPDTRPTRIHFQELTVSSLNPARLPSGGNSQIITSVSEDGVSYMVEKAQYSVTREERAPLSELLTLLDFPAEQVAFVGSIADNCAAKDLQLFFPFGLRDIRRTGKAQRVMYVKCDNNRAKTLSVVSTHYGSLNYTEYPNAVSFALRDSTQSTLLIQLNTAAAVWTSFGMQGRHGRSAGFFCTEDQLNDYAALLNRRDVTSEALHD